MSRTSSTRLGIHDRQRILSSPVALAFVRILVTRRGISEAKARKLYLDYINDPKSVSWTANILVPDGSFNPCARVHGG